jgi:hypothetical protein
LLFGAFRGQKGARPHGIPGTLESLQLNARKITSWTYHTCLNPDEGVQAVEPILPSALVPSGRPAEIGPAEGQPFSLFGGVIIGWHVELVPDRRIVQAWRETSWEPGVYSLVRFDLRPQAGGTLIVFDHTGFPMGAAAHLAPGWGEHYWEPLKKFLA